MDTEEFVELAESLNLTPAACLNTYADLVQSGWVKLLNEEDQALDRCIFLGPDSKTCSIYKQRPAQCRTYPYWPRLIATPETWQDEAVVPDDSELPGRKWDHDRGGCEGLEGAMAPVVSTTHIYRNSQLYDSYMDSFPFTFSGDDRSRLLAKAEIMQGVTRATRAWVEKFVIGYQLCPFAEAVFEANSVRYRVFLGSDRRQILTKVRYEMLHMLTTPEEEVATTLLMLPFAFPDFEEFYDFAVELEDEIIPQIEDDAQGPNANGATAAPGETAEVQLATFHPLFQWGGMKIDDPLNYEKRAPFPTINLLRAARVREFADQAKSGKIADSNMVSLEDIGADALKQEFQDIIELALEGAK